MPLLNIRVFVNRPKDEPPFSPPPNLLVQVACASLDTVLLNPTSLTIPAFSPPTTALSSLLSPSESLPLYASSILLPPLQRSSLLNFFLPNKIYVSVPPAIITAVIAPPPTNRERHKTHHKSLPERTSKIPQSKNTVMNPLIRSSYFFPFPLEKYHEQTFPTTNPHSPCSFLYHN